MIPFPWHSRKGKGKFIGMEVRSVAASLQVGWGLTTQGHEGTLWGYGSVLYLDYGHGYVTAHGCSNS